MRISLPAAGRMNGESTAALKQAETENGLQITGNDVILKDMASFLREVSHGPAQQPEGIKRMSEAPRRINTERSLNRPTEKRPAEAPASKTSLNGQPDFFQPEWKPW